MTDIKHKLPLKIATTGSVIVTADQYRISCSWADNTRLNDYQDTIASQEETIREFAKYIVLACNSYYDSQAKIASRENLIELQLNTLVFALEGARDCLTGKKFEYARGSITDTISKAKAGIKTDEK